MFIPQPNQELTGVDSKMFIPQPNQELTRVANVNREDTQGEAPNEEKDRSWYLPLHKAILKEDWESAKSFFDQHMDAVTAIIGLDKRTALHIAIETEKSIHFIRNLVNMMPPEVLALPDIQGSTALHFVARTGNTEAAAILLEKNRALLHTKTSMTWKYELVLPVHSAALYGKKDTLQYLLAAHYKDTDDMVGLESLTGQSGVLLLARVVEAGFFDVALDLLEHYPDMARSNLPGGTSALSIIATRKYAFPSGRDLNLWERFIWPRVPLEFEDCLKNANRGSIRFLGRNCYFNVWQKLYPMLWKAIRFFVPKIKEIQNTKLMHHQAIRLVEVLCKEIRLLNTAETYASLYEDPILDAAKHGIHEVVEKIVEEFPDAVFSCELDNKYHVIHMAVINRCKNIFHLANQKNYYSPSLTMCRDLHENNILHLAGRLAPVHKLNLVPGAALQMQSEIQWFKKVETLLVPSYKVMVNEQNETPAMVFTREHKSLVIEGEKWMKDTANSCTIAAALIVTVVFAAAITVPGGNNGENGHPIFHKEKAFVFFAVSDAISLFTSTTSLLMFLSILTSRYSESDFLLVLPRRLIIGLVTLFLSITTMMMAFGATLYLLFDGGKAWHLVPVIALACLPIASFVLLQFPLLVDVIRSTYWPGILAELSNHHRSTNKGRISRACMGLHKNN